MMSDNGAGGAGDGDETFAQELSVRVADRIATITLNRPEVGNALTRPMMIALAGRIRRLGADPDVHAVAISGAGDSFCLGRDARGASGPPAHAQKVRDDLANGLATVFEAIAQCPVPVVSLVQGPARNFGVTLAVACDMALCAERATFRYLEIEEGFAPTTAAAVLFPHVAPKSLAYLMYGACEFSSAQALSCGMVSDVVADAEFAARASAFVALLASRPRSALQSLKLFTSQAGALTPQLRTEFAISIRALASSVPKAEASRS